MKIMQTIIALRKNVKYARGFSDTRDINLNNEKRLILRQLAALCLFFLDGARV